MNAIEKLQSERQRLVARLTEIDKILGQYDELQRIAESYLATGAPHMPITDSAVDPVVRSEGGEQKPNIPESTSSVERKSKTPMADFERIVCDVLTAAEKPLGRSALYEALQERGVVIGSPDQSADMNTLSARMSRMSEKVMNVKGYGYWLKGRAFPEGGYNPGGVEEAQGQVGLEDNSLA